MSAREEILGVNVRGNRVTFICSYCGKFIKHGEETTHVVPQFGEPGDPQYEFVHARGFGCNKGEARMTLRDEIAALKQHEGLKTEAAQGYYTAIDDVLAIIDRREVDDTPMPPSEERPAREALRAGYESMDFTQSIMAQHGLAIVEAIDAQTAAIREAKR